jgi:Ca2+-binding RTX toxin-like protein
VGFGSFPVIAYAAAPGETNAATLVGTESGFQITDSGAVITAGAGCTSSTPHTATCSRFDVFLVIELDDGNDSLTLDNFGVDHGVVVRAGEGDDTVVGGDSFTERLYGGPGNDTLRGGQEMDIIDGGPGADVMSGGTSWHSHANFDTPHPDTLTYAGRSLAVRADLNGLPDDGEAGEGDRVLGDFEILVGGAGPDTLVGNHRTNFFSGGAGNDNLDGRGGHDQLRGNSGHDRVQGGQGRDRLRGDAGKDVVIGGLGRDWIAGGPGEDLLRARDGAGDQVRGGPNRDQARVDRIDYVVGVERLVRL